jgi:hypothetical protein
MIADRAVRAESMMRWTSSPRRALESQFNILETDGAHLERAQSNIRLLLANGHTWRVPVNDECVRSPVTLGDDNEVTAISRERNHSCHA